MKIFKKAKKKELMQADSKETAKERLRLVLMQDRANVSADFLDLMSGKTELDEASLTDLLTVQIMGCLGMCRKHLGESDEEWCRFQSCFDLFLKAGYQGIIQK